MGLPVGLPSKNAFSVYSPGGRFIVNAPSRSGKSYSTALASTTMYMTTLGKSWSRMTWTPAAAAAQSRLDPGAVGVAAQAGFWTS